MSFFSSPLFFVILFLIGLALAVMPYIGIPINFEQLAIIWVNGVRAGLFQVAGFILVLLCVFTALH